MNTQLGSELGLGLGSGLGLVLGFGLGLGSGLGLDSVRGSTISHKMKYLPNRRSGPLTSGNFKKQNKNVSSCQLWNKMANNFRTMHWWNISRYVCC